MDHRPIGGQFAPSEQIVVPLVSEEDRRAAMLRVCANATDTEDARELLAMLGLVHR